jgi:precorrin-6B methylase 2
MRPPAPTFVAFALCLLASSTAAAQQNEVFPEVGRPGKDVVWVPTPNELVERMLDVAKLAPNDYLIDLGSGDGRIVIAAARRGARAQGVEYSPKMVELARQNAKAAGVWSRAAFVQGDMYKADISKATVLGLFLLPGNLLRLRDTFLTLAPGTRIVVNEFSIPDWEPDAIDTLPDCKTDYCTTRLWIVPAKVQGTWTTANGDLVLRQQYQMVTGRLGDAPLAAGRVRGAAISFSSGGAQFSGQVKGNIIDGTATRGAARSAWRATRR